jgi:hypothetical protein
MCSNCSSHHVSRANQTVGSCSITVCVVSLASIPIPLLAVTRPQTDRPMLTMSSNVIFFSRMSPCLCRWAGGTSRSVNPSTCSVIAIASSNSKALGSGSVLFRCTDKQAHFLIHTPINKPTTQSDRGHDWLSSPTTRQQHHRANWTVIAHTWHLLLNNE